MPNQLPKNQNQSNSLSFRNEKHLNLIENSPVFEHSQEERISSFILIISIFLGLSVSAVNYLNLTSTKTLELDTNTKESLEVVKSKETYMFELKKDVDFLNKYKLAKDSIKIKQGNFYVEIADFLNYLGRPEIESLTFNQDRNTFKFKLIFFSGNTKIEDQIKEFEKNNKKFSNLKLETLEKLSETKETKYTYTGEIDGK